MACAGGGITVEAEEANHDVEDNGKEGEEEEEEYELDEDLLPSTLFFGVRGRQV